MQGSHKIEGKRFLVYVHPSHDLDSKHASIVGSRRLKIYSIEGLERALIKRGINPKPYLDAWNRYE